MKLNTFLVNVAGKLILDNQLWADVKTFVSNINDNPELTNEQKHNKVKQDLIAIFGDIGNTILNLCITMAVAWIKSKQTN